LSEERDGSSMNAMRTSAAATVLVLVLVGGGTRHGDRWTAHAVTRASATGLAPNAGLRPAPARSAAAWCGTPSPQDATPNAVAGYATHWIYAFPSDGADGLATYSSAMQSDAEAIDAWWRSQDATRTPRSDLAQFACGLQLDLSDIKLSDSSAQLAAYDVRFERIADALMALGFSSQYAKYVVYYDGPANPEICGEGGSDDDGHGFAIVYVRGCTGVPASKVAAHELLHTLGAVPTGAPHECAPPLDGHVCDDQYDLMYPFGDETPIGSMRLDSGRDDYYGHGGAQLDVQDSPWLVQLDRQVQLALAIAGPGSVTADLPGLSCTKSCTTAWNADTPLVLTAEPAAGAKLVRWGAGCAGASACSVTLSQSRAVTALFAPRNVTVSVSVSGRGKVRGSPGGIVCPARCSSLVPSFEPVRLTATPAKGWRLRGWSGSCRVRTPACVVPMTADTRVHAVFVHSA
jgi:hypothetical protein